MGVQENDKISGNGSSLTNLVVQYFYHDHRDWYSKLPGLFTTPIPIFAFLDSKIEKLEAYNLLSPMNWLFKKPEVQISESLEQLGEDLNKKLYEISRKNHRSQRSPAAALLAEDEPSADVAPDSAAEAWRDPSFWELIGCPKCVVDFLSRPVPGLELLDMMAPWNWGRRADATTWQQQNSGSSAEGGAKNAGARPSAQEIIKSDAIAKAQAQTVDLKNKLSKSEGMITDVTGTGIYVNNEKLLVDSGTWVVGIPQKGAVVEVVGKPNYNGHEKVRSVKITEKPELNRETVKDAMFSGALSDQHRTRKSKSKIELRKKNVEKTGPPIIEQEPN